LRDLLLEYLVCVEFNDILNYFVMIEILNSDIGLKYSNNKNKNKIFNKKHFFLYCIYFVLFSIREMRITNCDLLVIQKLFQEFYWHFPFNSLFLHVIELLPMFFWFSSKSSSKSLTCRMNFYCNFFCGT